MESRDRAFLWRVATTSLSLKRHIEGNCLTERIRVYLTSKRVRFYKSRPFASLKGDRSIPQRDALSARIGAARPARSGSHDAVQAPRFQAYSHGVTPQYSSDRFV
jgi:hypothetical protein